MRAPLPFSSPPPVRAEVRPGMWLDSRLAVWIEAERVLVVADLHWGYAQSHRARGNLLPAWGDDEIEQRLETLVRDYQPAEMVWLGDVVHAAEGAARAEKYLRQSAVRITQLAGNHDRRWKQAGIGSAVRGRYFFHHGDTSPVVPADCIEVLGHHHPAVSWADGAGSRLKLPALVVGTRRMVLPAFSPWAAGAPWQSNTEEEEILWAIGAARIFSLPRRKIASNQMAS